MFKKGEMESDLQIVPDTAKTIFCVYSLILLGGEPRRRKKEGAHPGLEHHRRQRRRAKG